MAAARAPHQGAQPEEDRGQRVGDVRVRRRADGHEQGAADEGARAGPRRGASCRPGGWPSAGSSAGPPDELAFYPQIVALNHAIVAEAFSRGVITPGVTTIDDLAWWVRERIAGAEARHLVPADVLHRPPRASGPAKNPRVVEARRHAAVRHRHHLHGPHGRHPAGGLRPARRRDGRAARGCATRWPPATACRTSSWRR